MARTVAWMPDNVDTNDQDDAWKSQESDSLARLFFCARTVLLVIWADHHLHFVRPSPISASPSVLAFSCWIISLVLPAKAPPVSPIRYSAAGVDRCHPE